MGDYGINCFQYYIILFNDFYRHTSVVLGGIGSNVYAPVDMYNHEQSTNHKTLQYSKTIMNAVFILRNSSTKNEIDSQDIQDVEFISLLEEIWRNLFNLQSHAYQQILCSEWVPSE